MRYMYVYTQLMTYTEHIWIHFLPKLWSLSTGHKTSITQFVNENTVCFCSWHITEFTIKVYIRILDFICTTLLLFFLYVYMYGVCMPYIALHMDVTEQLVGISFFLLWVSGIELRSSDSAAGLYILEGKDCVMLCTLTTVTLLPVNVPGHSSNYSSVCFSANS